MTSSQLLEILIQNSKSKAVLKPIKRLPPPPRKDRSYTHNFYDLSHIELLTKELLKLNDSYNYDQKYGARYLVQTNGRIVFSREGRPGKYIPGHKQISRECLAAGNIYFNADYSKIIKINHESGDFRPSIETLSHPLNALLSSIPHFFDKTLDVEVKSEPSLEAEIIPLNKEELIIGLNKYFIQARLNNQPWESIRTDSYIDSSLAAVTNRKKLVPDKLKRSLQFNFLAPVFEKPKPRSVMLNTLKSSGLFFSPAPEKPTLRDDSNQGASLRKFGMAHKSLQNG